MGSGPIGFLEEAGLTGEDHGQDWEAGPQPPGERKNNMQIKM